MANAVAIISVLSTAVVAVTVPFLNARLERGRLAWQSKQRQSDELRRLLDASMLRIQEARVVLWEILEVPFPGGFPRRTMDRFATVERSAFSEEQLSRIEGLTNRYEEMFQEVTQDQTRINLRLGPDDSVTKTHYGVMRQFLAFRPRSAALTDLTEGASTVTVSWSQLELENLAAVIDDFAEEVRGFFGSVRDG
jgi:hypothetical protein